MAMKLLPSNALRSALSEFGRNSYHIVVPPDVSLEQILTPGFWAHHGEVMRPGDLVDILSEDLSLDYQLRVVEAGKGFVRFRVRFGYESEDRVKAKSRPKSEPQTDNILAEVPEGYRVDHTPKTGWRIHTKNPDREIGRNYRSKREAVDAAKEHHAKATTPTEAA